MKNIPPTIALDATYAAQSQPTGIGIYSQRLIGALETIVRDLGRSAPRVVLGFRPGPFAKRAWRQHWPPAFRIAPLADHGITFPRADLFHGLNQRLPDRPYGIRVVTLHERFPAPSDEYSTAEFRSHMAGRIEHALAVADCIIAVSNSVAQHLAEHRPHLAPRIRVIHHGVDPAAAVAEHRTAFLTTRAGLEPAQRYFVNVGAVQIRKNLKNLTLALKPLDNLHLVIAGSDGFGATEIRQFVAEQGLGDRVHFVGHLKPHELQLLYSGATALVFPSLEEAFGMPILEAMSCGCPVITSDVAAMPEVAGEAALLVNPSDVAALTLAMRRIIEDTSLAASLRLQGLRRAAMFSWEKCANETWAVYEQLLANRWGTI